MASGEKRVEFLIIIIQGVAATLPVWPRDLNRQLIAIKYGNIKFKFKVLYLYLCLSLLNLWIVTKSSANLPLRGLFCWIFMFNIRTLATNCLCLCLLDLKKVVLAPKIKPTDPYGGRFIEFFIFITFTLATKIYVNIPSIGKQPRLYRFCRETPTENLLLQGSEKLIQNTLQKSTD